MERETESWALAQEERRKKRTAVLCTCSGKRGLGTRKRNGGSK